MFSLSNTDFIRAIRLLSAFADTVANTRREREDRRQAALLIRKMQKRRESAK